MFNFNELNRFVGENFNMKVSILIPTFNRIQYLPLAIESALKQDYENMEVIVSDNASKDGTDKIVNKYIDDIRFKYFRNMENIGMVLNWRKALDKYATGDFFMILSDDDYLVDSTYISKAVELIENHPEIVMVYANSYLYHDETKKRENLILPFKRVEDGKTIFLSRNTVIPQDFCLCNVLFKRSLALKLNAFMNEYNIFCDSELFLKMSLYGKVGIIQDFVSVYLFHADNLLIKLNKDFKLLINSYDHLSEPYKLAKESNLFSDNELIEWENRLKVNYMMQILFETMLYQEKHYKKTLILLKKKDPVVLKKVKQKFRFKLILLLYKIRFLKLLYGFNNKIRS